MQKTLPNDYLAPSPNIKELLYEIKYVMLMASFGFGVPRKRGELSICFNHGKLHRMY